MTDIPDLLAHQFASFERFAQAATEPGERAPTGIEGALRAAFPIVAWDDGTRLEYGGYRVEPPRDDPRECLARGDTWTRTLVVTLRGVRMTPGGGAPREIAAVIERELPLGAIPWMTPEGTFVIDGVERVVQAQLARCPGAWFREVWEARAKRPVYLGQLVPRRGPRVELRLEHPWRLRARIGQGRWFPATDLVLALGVSRGELLRRAYPVERLLLGGADLTLAFDLAVHAGRWATRDLHAGGELLVARHRRYTRKVLQRMVALGVTALPVEPWDLHGRFVADDLVDPASGRLLAEAGDALTEQVLEQARACGLRELPLLVCDELQEASWIRDCAVLEGARTVEQAQRSVWRSLRPPLSYDPDEYEPGLRLRRLLCAPECFDLGPEGRARTGRLLGLTHEGLALTPDDVVALLLGLARRALRLAPPDDERSLVNAVARPVGELLEARLHTALGHVRRAAMERMALLDAGLSYDPAEVVSASVVERLLREFFTRSRLSRVADQTSPVARVSQARWLAGVEPERFAGRRTGLCLDDTIPSQYGLLCPVEAPLEGDAPGHALALLASVGPLGALRRLVLPVADGAFGEARPVDVLELARGPVVPSGTARVEALDAGGGELAPWPEVRWADPCPEACLGALAALVPFAVHDEAVALALGVRNLREALPPLRAKPPRVRTALDARVAYDSRVGVRARLGGAVVGVSGRAVLVREGERLEAHALRSFEATAGGAVVRERPCVREGERVAGGAALADVQGVRDATLACGDDALVALMTWAGLTDGASVAVSERVVREGRLATLQGHVAGCALGRSRGGVLRLDSDADDITDAERDGLDPWGLVRVGARVRPGDVLAARRREHPSGRMEPCSLRAPAGCEGVVTRAVVAKRGRRVEVTVLRRCPLGPGDLLGSRHGDRGAVARVVAEEDLPMLSDGRAVEVVVNPAAVVERGAVGTLYEMLAAGGSAPIEGFVMAPSATPAGPSLLGHPDAGGVALRDGRTGEPFAARVFVGTLHLFKLGAPAETVLEARSRAAVGSAPGQLFDDDAAWALAAHGAAYTLRETLTARGDAPRAAEHVDRGIARGAAEAVGDVPVAFVTYLRALQAAGFELRASRRRTP